MSSISTPDLEGILEQKGILGMVQRLNLNYSLDNWVYHDRKEHKVYVDTGIRLFSPVCGCVGMVHLNNLGPESELLISRIDIGIPVILPPKTGIFAHQMEPVDTPAHFENEVKELIEHFPMILDKWTSSKAHYERERKKEESERKKAEDKRPQEADIPSMPAPAEPPTITCPRVDTEPVAAPEKKEPPTIVCPSEPPKQEVFATVETEPERIEALDSKPEVTLKKENAPEPEQETVKAATSNSFYTWLTPELNKLLPRWSVLWKVQTDYAKKEFKQDFVYIRVADHITPAEEKRVGRLLFIGRARIGLPGEPVYVRDNDPVLNGNNVICPEDERLEHVFPTQMDMLVFRNNLPQVQQTINSSDNSLHIPEMLDDIKTMCKRWDLPLRTEETDCIGELFDHMAVDFAENHPDMDFNEMFSKVIGDRLDAEYTVTFSKSEQVPAEPKMDEMCKTQQSNEPTKPEAIEPMGEPEPWPNMPEILEKRIDTEYTDGLPRFNILWDVKNDEIRRSFTAGHAYLIIAVNLSPSEMLRMTNYLDHKLTGKVEGKLTVVDAGNMNIHGVLNGAPIITPWHRSMNGMLPERDHLAIKTCGFGFEKVINGKGHAMYQPCAGMILWQLQKDHDLEDCSNAKSLDEAIDRTAANLVKKYPSTNFFTTWVSTELKDPKD
jgi:hypothetical protein